MHTCYAARTTLTVRPLLMELADMLVLETSANKVAWEFESLAGDQSYNLDLNPSKQVVRGVAKGAS